MDIQIKVDHKYVKLHQQLIRIEGRVRDSTRLYLDRSVVYEDTHSA
jgi:hypothetical protein